MVSARIFLAAGEASGDLHGARLARALRDQAPGCRCVGFGGDAMSGAGVELRANLVERAVMGVGRVARELGTLLAVAAGFLDEIRRDPPDALVLIDYPGLNLNLARMARHYGIPVIYYICPQVWAWAPWRMPRIARRADLLLVILPFEEALYGDVHPHVHFVGNPVFDHLAEFERAHPRRSSSERVLALFPGSRLQEVEGALPMMLEVTRSLCARDGALRVEISCQRPALRAAIDHALASDSVSATVHEASPHDLQQRAWLSLVVSGTATLEQAYFGAPMVVLYPARRWQQRVFSALSVTPYIALVNVFAGRRVVPEFLAAPGDCPRIAEAAAALLDGAGRRAVVDDLVRLRAERFLPGGSVAAAAQIVRFLAERACADVGVARAGAP